MTAEYSLSEAAVRRFGGMLGLAAKAGRVSSGEFCCDRALKTGKAKLCILAADSSENTTKHFSDLCSFRRVRLIGTLLDKTQLGRLVGKKERAVITVDEAGFSETIVKIIEGDMAHG